MKIANFNISKKTLIILIAVVLVFVIMIVASNAKNKKELNDRIAAEQTRLEAAEQANNNQVVEEPVDLHTQIQTQLTEQFGVAPEGFEWDYSGELVPLGDKDLTAEDVTYTFIRSLSILDFSTAARYSNNSSAISEYQSYYGVTSQAITDYYENFLRKQFKESLMSIEVNSVSDTAVFADGTMYITLDVSVLDLSDKDFWLEDRDELFETMNVYEVTEEDDTKIEMYVYDYLYNSYKDGVVGKKSHTIELVISKESNGGWLVTNDRELTSLLKYEQGIDVARYILNDYNAWALEKSLNEVQQGLEE